ncbi:hypothetical protein BGZ96_011810 [Linnemannia gamsii]|uniref:Uncharacterized protein n=1 Tax=Linnemannia gamsii TaxID=64522 RepID=A0ABQ7JRL9_9FUNG|nr:hypothetical protein BGZ96_011810 [Linnemannia gamsii]
MLLVTETNVIEQELHPTLATIQHLIGLRCITDGTSSVLQGEMGRLDGLDNVVYDLGKVVLEVKADQQLLKDEVEMNNTKVESDVRQLKFKTGDLRDRLASLADNE